MIRTLAILLCLLVPAAALGASPPASAPSLAPASPQPVVVLLKDAPAPFDGLLVPEDTFAGYLRQRIDLETCRMRVEARDRLLVERPTIPVPAFPAPPKGGGLGVGWSFISGVGVLVAGALVWAAVQVLGATP